MPQKCNEFRKLSTKSCTSRMMNDLKENFTVMKIITTTTTILKMTILCHAIRQDLGLIFFCNDRNLG